MIVDVATWHSRHLPRRGNAHEYRVGPDRQQPF